MLQTLHLILNTSRTTSKYCYTATICCLEAACIPTTQWAALHYTYTAVTKGNKETQGEVCLRCICVSTTIWGHFLAGLLYLLMIYVPSLNETAWEAMGINQSLLFWGVILRSPTHGRESGMALILYFSDGKHMEMAYKLCIAWQTDRPTLFSCAHSSVFTASAVSINFSVSAEPREILPFWAVNHSEAIISITSHPFLFLTDRL